MEISKQAFNKSSSWIKRNARPLETARWEYLFEDGSPDSVVKYLSAFQNEDGGFGHGIEPDFWTPDSSPMATWAAGQILMEINADRKEEIVQSLISYLINTTQKGNSMWFSVLPENNHYPHAPWWHWKEGVQNFWMFNPSVELAAFLVNWSSEDIEASQIGWAVIKDAIDHLFTTSEMDSHEINNYQQLIKIMNTHQTTFESHIPYSLDEVSSKVMMLIENCMNKDLSTWSTGYNPLPLDFIDSPEHPLHEKYSDLVDKNITFYQNELSKDGTWDISWEWENYPEAFAIARKYWKGILVVDRYKILKSFGVEL